MKHPALAIFMIALAVPLMSCTIAGYIALSAVQPVNTPAESQSTTSEISSSSVEESKSVTVSTISQKNTGLKLIDISHFTNVTDWKAVSSSVNGIYIKATEGTSITDPKFQANAAGAMGAKIPTGFYHYFWPGSDTASSVAQADYFYKTIKNYDYKLYPVVDVEETNNQSDEIICADIKAFAQEFQKLSGIKVMIYSSANFANAHLTDKSLSQYPLWVAQYNVSAPSAVCSWQNYEVWQYGTAVKVPGIPDPVDADVATVNVFINQNGSSDSLPVTPVVDKAGGVN